MTLSTSCHLDDGKGSSERKEHKPAVLGATLMHKAIHRIAPRIAKRSWKKYCVDLG